jgi:type II restriction enzyme
MLIAERIKNGKIDIFDPEVEEFINFNFQSSQIKETTLQQIVKFCDKTGIINLFREIKDIHDYLLGVEVGLDSNARKNRSGDIFENLVQRKVKILLGSGYQIVNNDPNFSLYPILGKGRSKGKTHDVVVYLKRKPVLIIECNFYNVTGSKPISIAESYPEMYRVAKQHRVEFLWVTDGPAWHQMKDPLLRAMRSMEWVLNFRMLKYLPKIIKTFSVET